jgi:glycosyltransferase involved in cell wall biosynthesis
MNMLSVVIPALNEEDGIGDIIRRVCSIEPRLSKVGIQKLEVIVVDDGSRDRTAEIVSGFPHVRLLQHPVNRGYGAALKTGFYHAHGEWLAFLDADGTYPAEYLPELCQAAVENQADVVIGSRMSGADSEMPAVRRLGNRLFAGLLSFVGNAQITDSASGMRVLRREVLAHLYPLPDGLHFTPTMSTRALHEPLKMIEVPIPYRERVGRSKLSVLRDGVRFLHSIIWTAMSYNPVRILGFLGLAAMSVAGAVGVALVLMRASGITTLGPWGVFSVFAALAHLQSIAGLPLWVDGVADDARWRHYGAG